LEQPTAQAAQHAVSSSWFYSLVTEWIAAIHVEVIRA